MENNLQSSSVAGASLVQVTRWATWTERFWEGRLTFADIAGDHLRVHLRTYYPEGDIAPSFLEALFEALLQRLIDGRVARYDGNLRGPLRWPQTADSEADAESYDVLVQVIEGVASGVVDDYQRALRERWTARPGALEATSSVGSLFLQRLDAHCASIDALFLPQSLAQLDAVTLAQRIEALEEQWQASFEAGDGLPDAERSMVRRLTRSALGDWFAALGEADLSTLRALQLRSLFLEQQVQHLLHGVTSLHAFARQAIIDHARATLGIDIEPDRLQVETRGNAAPFSATRVTSLTALVAGGPFAPGPQKSRTLHHDPKASHAPLAQPFLDSLLQSVDPRGEYRARLSERHDNPELTVALLDLYDAHLQQSAFIARCRGHLSAESLERVLHIRESNGVDSAESGEKVVGVSLLPDLPLANLLLFHVQKSDQAAESLVLYAPGKPDGQAWVELPSLRAVAIELGGWLGDEAGREYLLGLIDSVQRQRAEAFFDKVVERADHWDVQRDHRRAPFGYRESCEALVALGKAHHLSRVELQEAPAWFGALPLAQRQVIAGLNEDLHLLNDALQRAVAGQQTFQAFAKRSITADIDAYLREHGVRGEVDPQTILFDFKPGLADSTPSVTRSLLDLAMYGYDDNWGLDNPRMPVRSSVGQDLSQLRSAEFVPYLRSAFLGDRFVQSIRAEFLDPTQAIYAERRALHRALTQATMLRDVHVAHARGLLTVVQFQRLAGAIEGLSWRQPARERGSAEEVATTGGVFRLAINGRQAVGLYVFRDIEEGVAHDWLYTPQAPDGIALRGYAGFTGAGPGGMQDYFLSHLRYTDRPAAALRLTQLAKGEAVRDSLREATRVEDFLDEYDDYLQRHIDDVEAVTTSRHDVIFELVVKGLVYAALPLSLVFPPLGFALDMVFVAIGTSKAIAAYSDGDSAGALHHWLDVALGLWGIALPGAWTAARQIGPGGIRSMGALQMSGMKGLRSSDHAGRRGGDILDKHQALKRAPENLRRLEQDGLLNGLFQSSPGGQSGGRLHILHKDKYFEVVADLDNQTLRLIDPHFPSAQYKMPIHRDVRGHWSFNPHVGLRGGGNDVHYLGQVSRVCDAFPARTNPLPARGALQGEGVIARFDPGASDNYLYSLNAQSCVVACLYNPSTRAGAVIHVDHNIRALLDDALSSALTRIGHGTGREPIKATLVGGDWLSGGADIGGPLRSALARKGIPAKWDHWSYSSCMGNIYGVRLDLAEGATTVFTTTRNAVQEVVDPILREASQGGSGGMARRGQRFMARFRQEPLVQRSDGSVHNLRGEPATSAEVDAQALLLITMAQ
ncbi:DUF6543 domain-containing protein [Pseudomonas huaxiensis]|uniref:DUF6543 domain-containing protein n=1 Tax=Pseudomonas huaxiensis TaxID=2213017 RepID=UPI000DA6C053|nr:DUF6543 domain-containing protein [Pseudomonas huaxiensis]